MYEFDEDTSVERVGDLRYRARLTERWSIGSVPNGGYVLAAATRALSHALGELDPLAVTAHFVRPALTTDAEIAIEIVKRGKTFSTARASLTQAGSERISVIATFGEIGKSDGPTHVDGAPPLIEKTSDDDRPRDGLPEIVKRFETRVAEGDLCWVRGERSEHAQIRARVRFADGRPPDVLSLPLFADALPPPAFHVIPLGWVPTLELGVHVRARPVPGWLTVVFRTRFVFGGLLEEDGELWDESGTLVALSRQLAAAPRAS